MSKSQNTQCGLGVVFATLSLILFYAITLAGSHEPNAINRKANGWVQGSVVQPQHTTVWIQDVPTGRQGITIVFHGGTNAPSVQEYEIEGVHTFTKGTKISLDLTCEEFPWWTLQTSFSCKKKS